MTYNSILVCITSQISNASTEPQKKCHNTVNILNILGMTVEFLLCIYAVFFCC